jgi:uncharacterized protein YceK
MKFLKSHFFCVFLFTLFISGCSTQKKLTSSYSLYKTKEDQETAFKSYDKVLEF